MQEKSFRFLHEISDRSKTGGLPLRRSLTPGNCFFIPNYISILNDL
jgi:hypothetical protein